MASDLKGVIIPPPEIRKICDKTADYVAKNGAAFEERVREKEEDNPKFAFLNQNDPYHAYYQHMITSIKEGKVEKQQVQEIQPEKKRIIPPKPSPFEFLGEFPAMSRQDLDILKLTAQFVARNGKEFLVLLAQREMRNFQFEFLKPSHSLYNYFTKLVDQYKKVLDRPKAMLDKLHDNVSDRTKIIDRVMTRVNFEAFMEEEQARQKREENEEKIAFSTIDWHDFIVVETIEFTKADDSVALPPPMSIMELESMTLEQRKSILTFDQPVVEDMEVEDMEEDEEIKKESPKPTTVPLPTAPIQKPTILAQNVKTDHVPKLGEKTMEQTSSCPRCGQSVKSTQLSEHIKICLSDPRAQEQKQRYLDKTKHTNLASVEEMQQSLVGMTSMRPDVFGDEDKTLKEKIDEQKKQLSAKVIWDGKEKSIAKAQLQMNRLQQQQAEQQQQKRQKLDPDACLIYVTLPSNETIDVAVPKTGQVTQLKEMINKATGISLGKQKLVLEDGTVLKNSIPMQTILSGTKVTLVTKERSKK